VQQICDGRRTKDQDAKPRHLRSSSSIFFADRGKMDWDWLDRDIAPLCSDKGRPGIETRFVLGLLLLKHIYALSDEGVCERWVYDPYFQYFTGEEFFQHSFPHERLDLTNRRKRLGDKLELLLAESLRVAHDSGALRTKDLERVRSIPRCSPRPSPSRWPCPCRCIPPRRHGRNKASSRAVAAAGSGSG
jgi:hypothetical protein